MTTAELRRRRREVESARSSGSARTPIDESWSRCRDVLDESTSAAPVDCEPDEVRQRWQESPIRRSGVGLEDQLEAAARTGDLVAAVTDRDGRILWSAGGASMRAEAERVGFVPGGRWDETSAGTNALGLALASRRPAMVFSAEHWCESVRDWVCWSVPVIDRSGECHGVIDLSGRWDEATPLAEITVATLARLVSEHLPVAAAPEGPPQLALTLLGRPTASFGGQPMALSRRQFELLAALALVGPCSMDQLRTYIYGERDVSPATVKAELSHLRKLLGGGIGSRPYRLTVPVEVDVLELHERLDRGDTGGATDRYRGILLPDSEAPFAVDHRYVLDVALREALLATGTAADLLRYASVQPYDDTVLCAAVERSAPSDPEHHRAVAQLERLRSELGD